MPPTNDLGSDHAALEIRMLPSIPESITATFTGASCGCVGQNDHAESWSRYHSLRRVRLGVVEAERDARARPAQATASASEQRAPHGDVNVADTPAATPRPGAQRTR